MKQPLHTPCPPQPRQQTRAPIQAHPPCAWSRTLRPLLSLLPLLLAIICPPAAAQKVMQPGAWEITTSLTRELPNQAAEAMGAHTVTMCLGSDFLAREPYFDATLDARKMTARQAQCSTANYQRQDNTASWHMRCTTADGSLLHARIRNTASATALQLRMEQDVVRPGGGTGRITISTQGRYAGACTSGMPQP